jgi:hypothetical protein
MPSYRKAKGAQFSTGPSRTFMAGSRSFSGGPGKTAMRGPNPSNARSITRRPIPGAGVRRTPVTENILLLGARGVGADGS